jgi:general secretion pathway protein F/type IV pilus assembly protein PilC
VYGVKMQFKYKGITKEGKSVKGVISANTIDEAKKKLKSQGVFYKSITPTIEFGLKSMMTRQMSGTILSSFSKEMASYFGSGMTVLTALKLMENQHREEKRYHSFLGEVKTQVEEGKSLYAALASQSVYKLPDFFLQSIKVAGQSGKMEEVLVNMGNFFALQNKVKKQVANAMAYPIFIFVIAIGMTGFLISFIVPKITAIFEDTGQELPDLTKFVLGLSDFLSNHYIGILLSIILSLVLFKVSYSRSLSFKKLIDSLLLKIPVFGSLIQNHELSRFSYIISLMLNSGVSYAQAVKLASSTFGNMALKELFARASQKVIEGNKLSNALFLSKGVKLKRNFMQSLALGEESSEVASVMFNISKLYSEENEDKLKLLLSLMEPFMMLFIGAVVGTIVMAMLLPIFGMNLNANKGF